MKFSTGGGSRVKHATGIDPAKLEKVRRRRPRPRHSTGESASIGHFTGKQMDYRALEDDLDGPDREVDGEPG